jgi:hypothetical protein
MKALSTGRTGRWVAERLRRPVALARIGSRFGETVVDGEAPRTWPAPLNGASASSCIPDSTAGES